MCVVFFLYISIINVYNLFFTFTQNGAALLAALTGFLLIPFIGLSGYLLAKLVFSWVPVLIYSASYYTRFASKYLLLLLLTSSAAITYICWSSSISQLTTVSVSVAVGLASIIGLYPLRKALI